MNDTTIKAALQPLIDAGLFLDKSVKNVTVNDNNISVTVELDFPAKDLIDDVKRQITEVLNKLPDVGDISVNVSQKILAHAVQKTVKRLPNVKNIITVASGKGGVGKSTTAVNLALALAAEGATVGLLDADVYGPSIPTMLGITQRPTSEDGETMEPIDAYGMQVMSIGLMIDQDTPMIWRGPMATQALEQLLNQTTWRDVDYLVIDMPPGTGDIQLTLAQRVPVTGAVIVTTPQDIALIDARKGYKMFEKVGVPSLGIVENMWMHVCSKCGNIEHIFGEGGAKKMSEDFQLPVLGALPLARSIREETDGGKPTVAAEPDGAIAKLYRDIAQNVAREIAKRPIDYSAKMPGVVVAK
jgi:ATP-binding protein involved in chromosome partitioning